MANDPNAGLGMMLSFLGQNSAADERPPPPVNMPQMNLPDFSNQQQSSGGGSGILKSILGNLAGNYLGDKLSKHQAKQDAQETGDIYAPLMEEEAKNTNDPHEQKMYGTLATAFKTGHPAAVANAMSAYKKYNERTPTTDQLNWADPEQRQRMTVADLEKGMTGSTKEMAIAYPQLKPGTTEYSSALLNLKRAGGMGNMEAPLTEFEISHLVDKNGNPVAQVPLGISRGGVAGLGMSIGKVSTESETKTAGSAATAADLAGRIVALRKDGHSISELPGAIINYRSSGELLPSAVNTAMNSLGYKTTPEQTKLISYTKNLSNNLLQAMRGAQVGPAEQEAFEKSLPVAGQPTDLFDQNLQTTMDNLKVLNERRSQLRGLPNPTTGIPNAPVAGPAKSSPLDAMTLDQLEALAKERGIE